MKCVYIETNGVKYNVELNVDENDHGLLLSPDDGMISIVGQLEYDDYPIVYISRKNCMEYGYNTHILPHPIEDRVRGPMIAMKMNGGVAQDMTISEYELILQARF